VPQAPSSESRVRQHFERCAEVVIASPSGDVAPSIGIPPMDQAALVGKDLEDRSNHRRLTGTGRTDELHNHEHARWRAGGIAPVDTDRGED
jgi:hypothetical protein